jgi:hypothetical protein
VLLLPYHLVRDKLAALPFEERKSILEAVINPTDGGQIILGTQQINGKTTYSVELNIRSDLVTLKSIINSVGNSDFLKGIGIYQ